MKAGKVLCVGATIVVRAYKRAVAMAYVGAPKGIVTYIKTETALYVCASGLFNDSDRAYIYRHFSLLVGTASFLAPTFTAYLPFLYTKR